MILMILVTLLSSCSSVNQNAICDGTERSRDSLTVALLKDGGPQSRIAGAGLLAQLDAGCGD
jgi:hypothetical protein